MIDRGNCVVPSISVKAVNTTGVGDGFVAGLLSGIAEDRQILDDGKALTKLCRFANAAGAITTTSRRAISALPTGSQVKTALSGM